MKLAHALLLMASAAFVGTPHAAVQPVNLADVQADLVFYDNFDGNTWGRNVTPIGWTVTNGVVDIVGSPDDIDYLPGNGYYVDLDGSGGRPGQLSKGVFLTEGVTYVATYKLAGSQRADLVGDEWPFAEQIDVVDVMFGTSSAFHAMDANDPLTTFTQSFTPAVSDMYQLSFKNRGSGDWVGAILAEVTIATVPEPSSVALMLLGLGGACWASRRQTRQKS